MKSWVHVEVYEYWMSPNSSNWNLKIQNWFQFNYLLHSLKSQAIPILIYLISNHLRSLNSLNFTQISQKLKTLGKFLQIGKIDKRKISVRSELRNLKLFSTSKDIRNSMKMLSWILGSLDRLRFIRWNSWNIWNFNNRIFKS